MFPGKAPVKAGSTMQLTTKMLRGSINYQSIAAGQSYPLFYDTLFADLRVELTKATVKARAKKPKLWTKDRTNKASGPTVTDAASLETNAVVFPKLFRRLSEWFATSGTITDFLTGMASLHTEQVQILDPTDPAFTNVTHFDNVLHVKNGAVRMLYKPEHLMFISAK